MIQNNHILTNINVYHEYWHFLRVSHQSQCPVKNNLQNCYHDIIFDMFDPQTHARYFSLLTGFQRLFSLKFTSFLSKVIQYQECRSIQFGRFIHIGKRLGPADLAALEWEPVWRGSTVQHGYIMKIRLISVIWYLLNVSIEALTTYDLQLEREQSRFSSLVPWQHHQ